MVFTEIKRNIYNIGSDLLKARLDTQYLGTFMIDP